MPDIELACVDVDGAWHPIVVTAVESHRVADLRAALGEYLAVDRANGSPAGPLYLGSMLLPDQLTLVEAELVDGAVVGVGRPLTPERRTAGRGDVPEIAVAGGLRGGPGIVLDSGTEVRVGRAREAGLRLTDPEVSRVHATVTSAADGSVRLADAGSHNGIRWREWRLGDPVALTAGDVASLGETVLGVRPALPADAGVALDPATGTRRFNRPPRIAAPETGIELVVPVEPEKPGGFRFPWVTVLLPLLFGAALYAFLPNAGYFLLIILLSPVMVLANVIGDRRSGRQEYKKRKKEYDAARETFDATLASARAEGERRCRQAHPDPSWVVSAACAPSARLWERRRSDHDFLRIRLGLHDRPADFTYRFDRRFPRPSGHDAELPDQPVLLAVPATVNVREAGVLGLAGGRAGLLAAARAVLAQVAGLHAPEDLGIVVITGGDEADDWEWLTWLPHTRPRTSSFACARLVGTDATQVEARLAELRTLIGERIEAQRGALRQGRPMAREFLVVVDGASRLRGLPGLAELLADGPAASVYALCVDHDETALPAECGATLVATNPHGSRARLRRRDTAPVEDVLVDGIEPEHAVRLAMALAPLATLGSVAGEDSLPEVVRFTELAELPVTGDPGTDAELVRRRWRESPDGRCTRAVLGTGPSGPLTVDLRRDGPHALVAGTSGAGKSELLQTFIASLAVTNTPDALTFVLVDYKGGSAFAACEQLPHCVGMVTDLDGHLATRALDSLSAELRRREALLARVGAKDILDYWARTGGRLPRLVIVVDEFATLVEELPDFVTGVVGIGMRGRSLGVHVVLATQRPGGVVNADMRANLNLRISLRVTSESDSVDVIDAADAARITARHPGRAYLRTGHSELTAFQAARVGWPRPAEGVRAGMSRTGRPLLVRSRLLGRLGNAERPTGIAPEVDADGCTDLSALVAASREAARAAGFTAPERPWLPPLATRVTLADLPPRSRTTPLCVRLGMADRPATQRQDAFEIDLEETGPVAIAGAVRTGRSAALRTLAAGLAEGAGPDSVHLYALDCGNRALAPLADLPHTGAVVDADDTLRASRLLDWLTEEVTRRQQLLAGSGHSSLVEQRRDPSVRDLLPYAVVLLDRLEGFLSAFAERDGGRYVDVLEGLLRRGPAVGVITVLSTDRTAFGHRVAAAVEHRLVLRQADRDDVAVFGLSPKQVPTTMPAGRALWAADGVELQIALLDADPSGGAQARALGRLAERLRAGFGEVDRADRPHRIDPLPEHITLADGHALRTRPRGTAPTVCTPAVGGDHLAPMDVDLAELGGAFVVAGPARSGRTTALAAIVHSLAGRPDGALPVVLVTPRRSSPLAALAELPGVRGLLSGDDADELEELVAGGPAAVVVDDGELVEEYPFGDALERFIRGCRDIGSVLVAAATTEDLLLNRFRGWLAHARRARTGLLLNPESHVAGEVFELRLSRSLAGGWPPGRGLVVLGGRSTLGQVPVAVVEPILTSAK
jgi:DNA segregation ATPase FtsK/SpoIIIE, S-DNA-T family